MVVFNPSKREIGAKIVYYGPAAGGKTTNLQVVHQKLNPNQRGEMVSLATKDDRTLFFDFLPLDLGSVKGFKTRFHLYTVPGQVYYVSTRRAVLTGVDGVIFVADSQESKLAENIESLEDLEKNLQYYGKKIEEIPMLLQYNKRDLDDLSSIEELNAKLNKRNLPFIEAVAVKGEGVTETLTMITKAVLESLEDSSKKPKIPSRKRAAAKKAATAAKAAPPPPLPDAPAGDEFVELEAQEQVQEVGRLRKQGDRLAAANEGAGRVRIEPDEDDALEFADDDAFADDDLDLDLEADLLDEEEIDMSDEPLEFGDSEEDIAADSDEPLEFADFGDEVITDSDEPLEFEDLEDDGAHAQSADESLPEEEKPFEFEVPDDDLELELESEPVAAGEDLILDDLEEPELFERSEPLSEPVSLEDPLPDLEDELLLDPEPAFEGAGKDQVQPSQSNGVEIVRCGKAHKVSPKSVRVPLTLKLTEGEKEVDLSLTIQVEDLLQE